MFLLNYKWGSITLLRLNSLCSEHSDYVFRNHWKTFVTRRAWHWWCTTCKSES